MAESVESVEHAPLDLKHVSSSPTLGVKPIRKKKKKKEKDIFAEYRILVCFLKKFLVF